MLLADYSYYYYKCPYLLVDGAELSSHHPLQNVQDADAVDGDEGEKVGRHVDLFQRTSHWVEGLQGSAFLHIPPLDRRDRRI